jgi:hypothetical protein
MVSPEKGSAPFGETTTDWQTHYGVSDGVRPLSQELWDYGQRFAPYAALRFTDEEAVTLYWCGILDGKCPIKTLYEPTRRYWRDGCPHLPRYGGFVQRLNRLADTFPVVPAQQGRRFTAEVAKDLATDGRPPYSGPATLR